MRVGIFAPVITLLCSTKGLLQKGFPSGGKKTASSLSRKRLMRADRKGNPQCKAIFAMFAQRTEVFPFWEAVAAATDEGE